MLASSVLMLLGSAAMSVQAAAVAPRAPKPYVPVLTESGGTQWTRTYPDDLNPVVEYYSQPVLLNITCWIITTMQDEKGINDGNPLWLGIDTTPISYISENSVQAGDIDFTEEVVECAPVQHAVGFVPEEYWNGTGPDEPFDPWIPCWEGTSMTTPQQKFYEVNYPDITCYVLGGQSVNGNTTWAKLLQQNCYLPGGWFQPNEYHGEAGLC